MVTLPCLVFGHSWAFIRVVTILRAYLRSLADILSANRKLALLLGLSVGLAACSGSPAPTVPAPQPMSASQAGPAGDAAPAAVSQYRLDSGDELRVIVFGQERLSGTFRVDDAGAISMPLLPPVGVRGLTALETKAAIEQALSQTLLRNPNVSVQVATFRPFFILGEVNSPGQYPYVAGMTVETAVAIAGGYTYRANTSRARITRGGHATKQEFKADPTAAVFPGDTVFIRERFF